VKNILTYAFIGLISFAANFLIYNYSFNSQATPFLSEDQRVDSALLMLTTTVPAYLVSALIVTIAFYWIAKNRQNNDKH